MEYFITTERCGLRPYQKEQHVYELGFHLRKAYWGKGYAYECASAVIEHAFSSLGAEELRAGHNPRNLSSARVLQKLGFIYVCDEYYEPTGLYHPSYKYSKV